jgi:hypothetical protein
MESIANSAEDYLVDSLSFKLPLGSSYVTDRKSSTFWAVGSNIYTPVSGVKVVKFQLNGDDGNWLDPASVVFQFTITNKSTDTVNNPYLRPLGQPHLFFKRLRVLAGGQVVEDIQDFHRYSELLTSLMNGAVRDNNDIQGFGSRWDSPAVLDATGADAAAIITAQGALMPIVYIGTSKVVNFKPLCGIFNQSKLIPLKFCPITLEFEVCDINDAIISPASHASFPATNTTNSWELSNCCIKCDICTLDSALNNSYVSHLLSGKSLPIEYSTYISQQSAIAGNNFAVQVIRAVSRLQRMFLTFYSNALTGPYAKPSINFYHPMSGVASGTYNSNYELEFQIQIGSKLIPEYPMTSLSECFYQLKKTLNLPEFHQHSIGIRYKNYYKDKFIFALSFEKIPESEWTGINTKAGQLLMIKVKAQNAGTITGDIANIMYVVLEAQQILEIRDIGTTVYD